jgi:hypothetical protein
MTWPANFTVAPFGTGATLFVVIIDVESSAGDPPIITFIEPMTAGVTTVAQGTNAGVAGVGRFGHPGRTGAPAMSVTRRAGAPPTITVICFGTGLIIPLWCGQVITALALQIGGTGVLKRRGWA